MKLIKNNSLAFSLVELLIVLGIIGVMAAVVIPMIPKLFESSTHAKNLANAKNVEQLSAALASLGVAHVIPESMGGVEATARLLREGVVVPEGPMAGEVFKLASLRDEDITELASLLRIQYDMTELRLIMKPLDSTYFDLGPHDHYCFRQPPPASRIERTRIGIQI